jgi:uncharacterized membrane protein
MNRAFHGLVGIDVGRVLCAVRWFQASRDAPFLPQPLPDLKQGVPMSSVQKSIDVNVPVSTTYNQWTQFEEFPRFMEGVKSVRQLDDKRLHWKTEIAGSEQDFDAIIDQQVPDQRIAWHSTIGAKQGGVVTFHRLSDNKTRVMLQMEYDPQGFMEKAGDMIGAVSMRIQGDLERFKKYVEERGTETGGWRGEINR